MRRVLNDKKPNTLEDLVREYIRECANPAPCYVMRAELRRRMAELVGEEDPAKSLARWHAGSKRRGSVQQTGRQS